MKTSYNDRLTSQNIGPRLDRFLEEVKRDAEARAFTLANRLQHLARSTHRWQNRTFATESSTQADIETTKDLIKIIVHVGTPYSVWLELARRGKWAWLAAMMLSEQEYIRRAWAEGAGQP